jgi:hypothetical protein
MFGHHHTIGTPDQNGFNVRTTKINADQKTHLLLVLL